MSQRPINLPVPGGTADNTKNIKQKLEEFKKESERYAKAKTTYYQDEKKHFYDDGKNEMNPMQNIIGGFAGELQSFAGELGSFDMMGLFQSVLGSKFGINFGTGMFGGLKKNFSTIIKALMAKFLTDNKATYKFIDYSKASLKKHLDNAGEYMDQLETELNIYFDRYSTLTEPALQAWVTNYVNYLKTANLHFEEAKIRLKLVESVLENHKVLDTPNKEAAVAEIGRGILELKGHMPEVELSSIMNTMEAITEIFSELKGELDTIDTARKNHRQMPDVLADELRVRGIFGLESIRNSIDLMEDLTSDIEDIVKVTSGADNLIGQSVQPWIASADAARAMLLQLESEVEPDLAGPEFSQVVAVSEALDETDYTTEYKQLVEDIEVLSGYVGRAFKKLKVYDLTFLRTRILANLSSIRTKVAAVEVALQIPDTVDTDVNAIVGEINSFGFDAMLGALLSGDILGFLMSKFGMSTTGGRLISLLSELIQGGFRQDSSPEMMFYYTAAKKDLMMKENASTSRVDPFKDIYQQGLDQYKDLLKEKLERLKSDVQRAKQSVK